MFKFIFVVVCFGLLSVARAGPLQDAAHIGDLDQMKKLLAEGAAVD
ncbi:MAG: hypothetical protein ABI832_12125 [bacterium]